MLCVLIRIASLNTIFNIKKKITLNYPKFAAMRFFQGPKNKFETAMVNKPSVFEPLKFYCILISYFEKYWPSWILDLPNFTILQGCSLAM